MSLARVAPLVIVLAAGAASVRGDAPATASAAAPRIVVEPAVFAFGTVRAGRAVEKEFVVRNHGRAELVIESVVSSCGCTAALTESKTVKPGGSTPLRVTFTAPEDAGHLQKSVLLKSNDPAHPTFEVKIEATVVAAKKTR